MATARRLETIRAALLAAAWPGENSRLEVVQAQEPPGRIAVIALRRKYELGEFMKPNIAGAFFHNVVGQPLIVLSADVDPVDFSVIKHELTHQLADRYLGPQPAWFGEGLATYLETIRVDRGSREATIGEVPLAHISRLIVTGAMPVKQLFEGKYTQNEAPSFYATSWFLVHYLLNEHGDRFVDYQNGLREAADADTLWQQVFPDLTPEVLDRTLADRVRQVRYGELPHKKLVVEVEIPTFGLKERPLPDAEVHAQRAELYLTIREHPPYTPEEARKLAASDIDEALRSEATNLTASLLRFYEFKQRPSMADTRAVVAANKDQWVAWLLLSDVLAEFGQAKGQKEALQQSLALDPQNPIVRRRWKQVAGATGARR